MRSSLRPVLPWIGAGLVLAAALAAGLYLGAALVPQPAVGVIPLKGTISPGRVEGQLEMLAFARDHPQIKAVVLAIDSPGGEVTASQELYLSTLELASRKPVLAAAGQVAASGAYHVALAADAILVQPASQVGSIGVIAKVPEPVTLEEDRLTTGPVKGTVARRQEFVEMLDLLRQSFLDVVLAHRGDRITLTPEELTTGRVFLGVQAVEVGLADEIGTRADAVARAAELAGLRRYRTLDVAELLKQETPGNVLWVRRADLLPPSNTAPSFHFLLLHAD